MTCEATFSTFESLHKQNNLPIFTVTVIGNGKDKLRVKSDESMAQHLKIYFTNI